MHESLTLSPCIELLQLHLGYCLQIDGTSVSKPGSVAMTGPQAPATPWLYNLIASITSRQLRYISIQLDVRRIKYKGPFQLLRLAQDFLSEQRFQQIDQLLSSHERFKNLRWVRIDLLCSPATHSPGQDTWKDAIRARFSLLHARKLLVYVDCSQHSFTRLTTPQVRCEGQSRMITYETVVMYRVVTKGGLRCVLLDRLAQPKDEKYNLEMPT